MSNDNADSIAHQKRNRSIIFALFFPTMSIILSGSMFNVALPTIRDEFTMASDETAWLSIAFSLPFMMFMPLYGRLGDRLGRSRMLMFGVVVFLIGSIMIFSAPGLLFVFLGRAVQGAGSAGITPLSLSIITSRFSESERGKALGTWNSVAPFTSLFAPSIGGFLIDSLGWRITLLPAILVSIFAWFMVRSRIRPMRAKPDWAFLRHFDWLGVFLLSGTVSFLVLFVSSRPVTGVEPLRDWRLLLVFLVLGYSFINWERRRENPLVDLGILRIRPFRIASIGASFRMAMMVGHGFLLPLYLTDIYDLSASSIGLFASLHSLFLFISIRYGGNLADRIPNRRLILMGLTAQMSIMLYFALLPAGLSLFILAMGSVIHGFGAGLELAALHRTAMGSVGDEQSGAAAGVYSMTRFAGSMMATALAGVILQTAQDAGLGTLRSYQLAFGFLAACGIIGFVIVMGLREQKN